MIEVEPLLETLSKVSEGRVLQEAERKDEGDFHQIKIPVCWRLPEDPKDRALRRFASDWIRRNVKDVGVETSFEDFPPGASWKDDDGVETPLVGAIVVSWWPRPPVPEYEQLRQLQKSRRFRT